MSGIAGIVDFSGSPIPESLIGGMLDRMAHRGRDGTGHWVSGAVALGHCMTHSTPESLTETQPMVSQDARRVLVMDGRLDNWEELRHELGMPGANDAALVLAAFETWGEDYPSRLEGDYAIAIWDSEHQRLHTARDLFGRRPFYYSFDGTRFAFASEIGPLFTLHWIRQTLNEGMLAEWLGTDLQSFVDTFWSGIYRLKPRHQARVDRGGMVSRSSWEPDIHGTVPCRTDEEFIDYYRSMMRDIVRRQSRSHRPLAFEVSGGLDSSAVYALAHDLAIHGELLAPGMQGYTLAFPPGSRAHEVEYARAVGRHCGTTIRECEPAYRPLEWYRDVAAARHDFPGVPNGVMLFGMYEAAQADGATVIVGGYGGDEWTGQSTVGSYYADSLSGWNWVGLRRALLEDVRELGVRRTCFRVIRYGLVPMIPGSVKDVIRGFIPDGFEGQEWLSAPMRAILGRRKKLRVPRLTRAIRCSQRRLYATMHSPEPINMYEILEYYLARRSMETRTPFQSKRVVQFAFSTEDWMRHRGVRNRWLHRASMQSLLPPSVQERSGKADFNVTVQRANDEVRAVLLSQLESRRSAWLDARQFGKRARRIVDVDAVGLEAWVLWYVACCDAVVQDFNTSDRRGQP